MLRAKPHVFVLSSIPMDKHYRIGQLAALTGLTQRTIRYYDELGLLKTHDRTQGGQRLYSDADLIYIKRIMELKALSFSLDEISHIIRLGDEDESGEKRRSALLEGYKAKLEAALEKRRRLDEEVESLEWHVRQLEGSVGFKECPGSLCQSCSFKAGCSFREG